MRKLIHPLLPLSFAVSTLIIGCSQEESSEAEQDKTSTMRAQGTLAKGQVSLAFGIDFTAPNLPAGCEPELPASGDPQILPGSIGECNRTLFRAMRAACHSALGTVDESLDAQALVAHYGWGESITPNLPLRFEVEAHNGSTWKLNCTGRTSASVFVPNRGAANLPPRDLSRIDGVRRLIQKQVAAFFEFAGTGSRRLGYVEVDDLVAHGTQNVVAESVFEPLQTPPPIAPRYDALPSTSVFNAVELSIETNNWVGFEDRHPLEQRSRQLLNNGYRQVDTVRIANPYGSNTIGGQMRPSELSSVVFEKQINGQTLQIRLIGEGYSFKQYAPQALQWIKGANAVIGSAHTFHRPTVSWTPEIRKEIASQYRVNFPLIDMGHPPNIEATLPYDVLGISSWLGRSNSHVPLAEDDYVAQTLRALEMVAWSTLSGQRMTYPEMMNEDQALTVFYTR